MKIKLIDCLQITTLIKNRIQILYIILIIIIAMFFFGHTQSTLLGNNVQGSYLTCSIYWFFIWAAPLFLSLLHWLPTFPHLFLVSPLLSILVAFIYSAIHFYKMHLCERDGSNTNIISTETNCWLHGEEGMRGRKRGKDGCRRERKAPCAWWCCGWRPLSWRSHLYCVSRDPLPSTPAREKSVAVSMETGSAAWAPEVVVGGTVGPVRSVRCYF